MMKFLPKTFIVAVIGASFSLPAAAQKFSGGLSHSLAVCSDGTAHAWGGNAIGQLGTGNTTPSDYPIPVISLTGATDVVASWNHSMALKNDGTVWTWGYNGAGQLGDGTNQQSNSPVQVSGLADVIAISGGYRYSLALKNDGTVWAWGSNFSGTLGNGTDDDSNVPVQVSVLTGIVAVVAGDSHCLAIKNDGTLWAWGSNGYGTYGNGSYISSDVPVQITTVTGAIAIAAGWNHSLVLKSDGTVVAFGANGGGQLGNGTNAVSNVPVGVSGLTDVVAIDAGRGYTSMALKADGTVWAWGDNNYGILPTEDNADSYVPIQITGVSNVTAISMGQEHALAQSGEALYSWGSNGSGQLGRDGSSPVPAEVTEVCTITASVNEVASANDITIYPNPSEGIFTVDFTYPAERSIEVYNVLGTKIFNSEIQGNTQVDLSSMSKGIYMMKISQGNKTYSQKIVLQ